MDQRRTLVALSLAAFATVTVELAPTGMLPAIADGFGTSRSAAGGLVASWAVTIAVFSVPLVRATARLRRQRVIGVAVLITAATTVATATAPSLPVALAARVLGAAAHGVVWSLLVPHVSSLVGPERLGRAVSVVLAGPTAATVAGVPLATALAGATGWRGAFAVLAAPALVAGPVLLLGSSSAAGTGSAGRAGWWRDPSARVVLRTSLATAAVLAGHFAAATYTAVLVTTRGELSATAVAPVLLVFGAAGVGGLAVSGPLSDRFPVVALRCSAVAFTGGLAALFLLGTHVVLTGAVVAFWGFLTGLLPPVFQTRVTRVAAPAIRAEAGAVAITALNAGIAVGASLGGVALALGGPVSLITVAVGASALGTVALTTNRPARSPRRAVRGGACQSR